MICITHVSLPDGVPIQERQMYQARQNQDHHFWCEEGPALHQAQKRKREYETGLLICLPHNRVGSISEVLVRTPFSLNDTGHTE